MKKFIIGCLAMLIAFCSYGQYYNRDAYTIWTGRMGIGIPVTTPPNTFAHLQLGDSAGTKSFLLPRVNGNNLITSPRSGMFHYNVVNQKVYFRKDNGWFPLLDSSQASPPAIDVFLIAGQSNAQGYGSPSSGSPLTTAGTVYQFTNGAISAGNDPVGNANTSSAWPQFGITWNTLTGRKICFVAAAMPGSAQTVAANTGLGTWDTAGTLYDTSVSRLNAAIVALAAAGYAPQFRGVLWAQGETDAIAINSTTITQADYSAAFRKMIGKYRIAFGRNTPFYIFQTGKQLTGSDAGYNSIRQAQLAMQKADSLTNIVFYNAQYFIERGYQTDQYHYNQYGYNEMGRIGAEQIVNAGSYKWQEQGGNIYFTRGNVRIGSGAIPTYPLEVNDSMRVGGVIISREGYAGAPSMRAKNSYMTFLADQNLFIFQPVGTRPPELRLAQNGAGSSSVGTTPFLGVLSGFNFGTAGKKSLVITTTGPFVGGKLVAGNILIKPGTGYVVGPDTTQYERDSVIVELNSGATFSVLGGKTYLTDTLQLTNIPLGGTVADSVLVATSTGVVKRRDAASFSGGGGGSYSAGLGLTLASTTFLADTTYLMTKGTTQVVSGLKTFSSLVTATSGATIAGVTKLNAATLFDGIQLYESTGAVRVGALSWASSDANNLYLQAPISAAVIQANNYVDLATGGSDAIYLRPGTGVRIGSRTATTAWLQIDAGTTSKAPQKFTTGTLLTSPDAGALEYDGRFWLTKGAANRGEVQVIDNVSTSAGTLTLAAATTWYIFSGTTATWTLPAASASVNHKFYLKNGGSGTVTINTNASANELVISGSAGTTNTLSFTTGQNTTLVSNGANWYQF